MCKRAGMEPRPYGFVVYKWSDVHTKQSTVIPKRKRGIAYRHQLCGDEILRKPKVCSEWQYYSLWVKDGTSGRPSPTGLVIVQACRGDVPPFPILADGTGNGRGWNPAPTGLVFSPVLTIGQGSRLSQLAEILAKKMELVMRFERTTSSLRGRCRLWTKWTACRFAVQANFVSAVCTNARRGGSGQGSQLRQLAEIFAKKWSLWCDSNARPVLYEGTALPTELHKPVNLILLP